MTLTKEARERMRMLADYILAGGCSDYRIEQARDVQQILSELERVEVKVEQLRDEVERQTIVAECHEERREQWKARAEAAEAKVRALRDQIEHGGCVAAHVGEGTYECDATQPCGLCRLRGRAEAAEARVRELEGEVARLSGAVTAAREALCRRPYHGGTVSEGRATCAQCAADAALGHAAAVSCLNRIERENQRLRAAVEEISAVADTSRADVESHSWEHLRLALDRLRTIAAAALENATALHRAGNDETPGET